MNKIQQRDHKLDLQCLWAWPK